MILCLQVDRKPLTYPTVAKTTQIHLILRAPQSSLYQMPYRILQKYCLVFTFKSPLIHLELQNTPQTLSGCITREYYRF